MKDIFYQNKLDLILDFLLFIVALSLPFSSAFNSISIALLFLFSFVFFKRDVFLKNISIKKVYFFYMLFFIMQIISIFYSADKYLAIGVVSKNILFLALPITFININDKIDKNKIKIVFYGLLLSVLATLITAYYNLIKQYVFEDISIKYIFRQRFIDNGIYNIHTPYLALLIVFLLISSYKITFHCEEHINKRIRIVLMIFLSLSLLQVSGVMSIFVLSIFLIAVLLYSVKSNIAKTLTIMAVILIAFLPYQILKNIDKVDRVKGSENIVYRAKSIINSGDSVRQENWKSVIKVIYSNVIFGVGADGGLELLQKQRSIQDESYINKHNAHNNLLEILLRYGLVGFSIYFLIVFYLIKKAVITKNYFLSWFLFIFIISGLTESYLQRQIGLVFFIFFSLFFYTLRNFPGTENKSV